MTNPTYQRIGPLDLSDSNALLSQGLNRLQQALQTGVDTGKEMIAGRSKNALENVRALANQASTLEQYNSPEFQEQLKAQIEAESDWLNKEALNNFLENKPTSIEAAEMLRLENSQKRQSFEDDSYLSKALQALANGDTAGALAIGQNIKGAAGVQALRQAIEGEQRFAMDKEMHGLNVVGKDISNKSAGLQYDLDSTYGHIERGQNVVGKEIQNEQGRVGLTGSYFEMQEKLGQNLQALGQQQLQLDATIATIQQQLEAGGKPFLTDDGRAGFQHFTEQEVAQLQQTLQQSMAQKEALGGQMQAIHVRAQELAKQEQQSRQRISQYHTGLSKQGYSTAPDTSHYGNQEIPNTKYTPYLNNGNIRQFLDIIGILEGTKKGYFTGFGNTDIGSLDKHPEKMYTFRQTDGKLNKTSAAGKFQFTKTTWNEIKEVFGGAIKDFGPVAQDLGAIFLINRAGALQDVAKGDFRKAVAKLGGVWASFPSSKYAQPKHGWDKLNKLIDEGIWNGKKLMEPQAYKTDGFTHALGSSQPSVQQAEQNLITTANQSTQNAPEGTQEPPVALINPQPTGNSTKAAEQALKAAQSTTAPTTANTPLPVAQQTQPEPQKPVPGSIRIGEQVDEATLQAMAANGDAKAAQILQSLRAQKQAQENEVGNQIPEFKSDPKKSTSMAVQQAVDDRRVALGLAVDDNGQKVEQMWKGFTKLAEGNITPDKLSKLDKLSDESTSKQDKLDAIHGALGKDSIISKMFEMALVKGDDATVAQLADIARNMPYMNKQMLNQLTIEFLETVPKDGVAGFGTAFKADELITEYTSYLTNYLQASAGKIETAGNAAKYGKLASGRTTQSKDK